MQTPHRFLTTQHRRQRLALWALAMLSWVAAVLCGARDVTVRQLRQRYARVSIERLTRLIVNLLIVRAGELLPARPGKLRYWRYGRELRVRGFFRALIGAQLRRVLKPKDIAARISNLIEVLRNLDAHALRLAKRLRLTRLWNIAPARTPADVILALPTSPPAFADSS